jgi:hypothetical protein
MSKMKTWSRGGRNRAVLHGWWVLTIMGIWIVTLQCPSITAGRLRTLLCTSFTQPAGEIVSHFWCFLITFKWSCGLGILYRWMFVRKTWLGVYAFIWRFDLNVDDLRVTLGTVISAPAEFTINVQSYFEFPCPSENATISVCVWHIQISVTWWSVWYASFRRSPSYVCCFRVRLLCAFFFYATMFTCCSWDHTDGVDGVAE